MTTTSRKRLAIVFAGDPERTYEIPVYPSSSPRLVTHKRRLVVDGELVLAKGPWTWDVTHVPSLKRVNPLPFRNREQAEAYVKLMSEDLDKDDLEVSPKLRRAALDAWGRVAWGGVTQDQKEES